ncbi:hypothetical protein V1525DRAFT_406989 [Lipomyces kononenkoae]|uniref:Uncharacterized protein n=1 Tax=Lipomyces kononenkoae TaxID=34357 RepID=A0ACC3T052_LIPKO
MAELRAAIARSQQETHQLYSRISIMESGFNYIFHGGSLVTAAAAAEASGAPLPGPSSLVPTPTSLPPPPPSSIPDLYSSVPAPPPHPPVFPPSSSSYPHIPKYKVPRYVSTVSELYSVWYWGSAGFPAIVSLNDRYGAAWRAGDRQYYSVRLQIINEVDRLAAVRNISKGDAVLLLDTERRENNWTLNMLSNEIRKRHSQ